MKMCNVWTYNNTLVTKRFPLMEKEKMKDKEWK